MVIVSGAIGTDAAGRRTLALTRAVNQVLSAHGLPISRFAFGQTTSAEAMHEAINEALLRHRMIVTPTQPEYAWRIPSETFEILGQEIVDATRAMGFMVSLREAEEALVARGYRPSAPPPIAIQPEPRPEPQPLPPPPIQERIQEPTAYEPPIREITVQPIPEPVEAPERWELVPIYTPTATPPPPVYTPTVDAEEVVSIDQNTILMIVGGVIGGLALASMMKRGR